jgi:hypothetical protein
MMKNFARCFLLIALTAAVPAFAGVIVNSPGNGSQVSTSFNLNAWANYCSNQSVTAMGVSWDNSSQTSITYGQSINATASGGTGWHTLHVKAWGSAGAACVTDVAVNITNNASSSSVPSNATTVGAIQTLGNWRAVYDTGTNGGGASGWMAMGGSPSRTGNARRFVTTYTNNGGERYDASFGDDPNAQNFFYDAWVYLDGTHNSIANLEFDLNQTMADGFTAIFGFQCDGWTNTWDFTRNASGNPWSPNDQWTHSSQYCNPRNWSINTWHHVQISYSRTTDGWVTYKSVALDGKQQPINTTVYGAFALHWGPVLLTNFQVDGLGSGGTSSVYLDDVKISRW